MAIAWSKVNVIKFVEHESFYEGFFKDGKSFKFSKEDYQLVSENYWSISTGYVKSTKLGLLHRLIMKEELSGKLQIDHINNDRLDNRRENLRIVTQQENLHKKNKYSSNTSGCPGVKWNKNLNKWQAQITRNKKRTHLGVFDEFQDAVVARKRAEQQII